MSASGPAANTSRGSLISKQIVSKKDGGSRPSSSKKDINSTSNPAQRPSEVLNKPKEQKKGGLAHIFGGKPKIQEFRPSVRASYMPNNRQENQKTDLKLKLLQSDPFDVDLYVKSMIGNLGTSDEVLAFGTSLCDARDDAGNEIRKNVYKNYQDFVIIGGEITKLESDMLSFRGLLRELFDVSESFRNFNNKDGEPETLSDSKSKAKSPVTNTEKKVVGMDQIRIHQLKQMYSTIDGLSKHLPESETRTLMRDGSSSKYYEVNNATYKDKESVLIYVLSDAILITTMKRTLITAKSKTVVDKCYGIEDVGIIDLKDSPDILNAFKIIKDGEIPTIYRSDSLEEKRSLLQAIQRITDDILAAKRRERKKKTESEPVVVRVIEEKHKRPIVKDELSASDFRWLCELPDELDVLIAHRNFEEAVKCSENARRLLNSAKGETERVLTIKNTLNSRITTLSKLVALNLANPGATREQVQADIGKLLRLGLGHQARDIFLSARSSTIRSRLRGLKYTGDLPEYISGFTELTFKLMKNTCEWYSAAFSEPEMASGFMKWLQKELLLFTETLRRQVFASKQEFTVIAECLLTTLEHVQELRDVGLDITFMMDQIINKDILDAIETYSDECCRNVNYGVINDNLDPLEPNIQIMDGEFLQFDKIPKLSSSCYCLYIILTTFGSDIGILLSLAIYNKVVGALSKFFDGYFNGLEKLLAKNLTNQQHCVLLADSVFAATQLVPKIKLQLCDRFQRVIPELDEEEKHLLGRFSAFRAIYIRNTCTYLFKTECAWDKLDYSSNAQIIEQAFATDSLVKLLGTLSKYMEEMDPVIDAVDTMGRISEFILRSLQMESKKFGYAGIQQFLLDVQFFLSCLDKFIKAEVNDLANDICAAALKDYFLQSQNSNNTLKNGEWYDLRVGESIKKHQKVLIRYFRKGK